MTQFNDEQMQATYTRLAAKLRAFEEGLTEDEQRLVDLAVRHIAANGDKVDTSGFRAAAYEDEYGYKGRPCSYPLSGASGAAKLTIGGILLGVLLTITGGAVSEMFAESEPRHR